MPNNNFLIYLFKYLLLKKTIKMILIKIISKNNFFITIN